MWSIHLDSVSAKGFVEQRTDFPNSFTFDDVSQLDLDISTALANVREWRNSFVPINRVPLDILSLVPTHLVSQSERFKSTFVCRHWRRIFLRHGVLWSQLFLRKGEDYLKTLLERARRSALDISTRGNIPASIIQLFPLHAQQITSINFGDTDWEDILQFFHANPGPLPLLRTLTLMGVKNRGRDHTDPIIPPSISPFTNAVNMRDFTLHCFDWRSQLSHFSFPNLTTFGLYVSLEGAPTYRAAELLDFLEASPMLRKVSVTIIAGSITLDGIAEERVLVLPDVKTFYLALMDDNVAVYKLATHISCPSVKFARLVHERGDDNQVPQLMFPPSPQLHAIVRQYAMDPIEEIVLELEPQYNPLISCSLTFRSPDASALGLKFKLSSEDGGQLEDLTFFEELQWTTFDYASATIQNRPHLHNLKRLLIRYKGIVDGLHELRYLASTFRELMKSMGPLDMLSISGWDPHVYLTPFLDVEGFAHAEDSPSAYPPIKELKIFDPWTLHHKEECSSAIVKFAKSQHARGKPFERLELCMGELPPGMAEELRPWVGEVDCRNKTPARL